MHYLRHWVTPYHYWSFVDCRYVTSPHVQQYVYRSENNSRFIGRTRTAGSVRYDGGRIVSRGPDVTHVERRGNIRVDRTPLVDVGGRDEARVRGTGEREQIGVYRPRIEERSGNLEVERPRDVKDQERMPSLDARAMDIRQRQNAREEGRSIERMDPSRTPRTDEGVGRVEKPRTPRTDESVGRVEKPRTPRTDESVGRVEKPRTPRTDESVGRVEKPRTPRTDESVGRVERQGTRGDRVIERPRNNSDARPAPPERQPRVNRESERMRSAPEGQSSSRGERGDAGRSAPGQRDGGERRGRR